MVPQQMPEDPGRDAEAVGMDDPVILKQGQLAVFGRERQDLNPVSNCILLARPLDCM